jgi:hypothetical protein
MTSKSFSHSASYTYIDVALRSQWNVFCALEKEMAVFTPRPIEEFEPYRKAEIERMQILNPDTPIGEITAFVENQIQYTSSHDWQFRERFDQRFMTEYVNVVMLSHSLCEALINAILVIGLANIESTELFLLLEKADFKQKWLYGPKSFSPSYQFPHGTGLHETLVMLSRQRNALVHYKIELKVDNIKVLEGSDFQRKRYEEERRWIRRYFSLPYDLAEFIHKSIRQVSLMFFFDRKPIEVAREHKSA